MSLIDAALAAARRGALGLARLFLRTPLERAALDAAPAALRLADAARAYFATPQGAADKLLFEALAAAAGPAMQAPAAAPPDAAAPADADIAPSSEHYAGAHGGSIYTGEGATR